MRLSSRTRRKMSVKISSQIMDSFGSYGNSLVSGHRSFSDELGLRVMSEFVRPVLRYMANQEEILGYVLTVECTPDVFDQVKHNLTMFQEIKKLHWRLKKRFRTSLPILVFTSEGTMKFSVTTNLDSFEDFDSESLKAYFTSINPKLVDQSINTYCETTIYAENSFDIWSEANLSKSVFINEFDVLYTGDSGTEIFAVVQTDNVSLWRPCVGDSLIYNTLLRIAHNIDDLYSSGKFWVLAINPKELRGTVAVNSIRMATTDVIKGKTLSCSWTDFILIDKSFKSRT